MNIPGKILEIAMMYSLFDENPVIVSYFVDDKIEPMVFINGAPIPYRVFVMLFAERMHGIHAFNYYVDKDCNFIKSVNTEIGSLWRRINLPNDIKNKNCSENDFEFTEADEIAPANYRQIKNEFPYYMTVRALVRQMYNHRVSNVESLRNLVHMLEEKYTDSLENPKQITMEDRP